MQVRAPKPMWSIRRRNTGSKLFLPEVETRLLVLCTDYATLDPVGIYSYFQEQSFCAVKSSMHSLKQIFYIISEFSASEIENKYII
jgi:hypothetical protein